MVAKFSAGDRTAPSLWPLAIIVGVVAAAAPLTAAVYGQISRAKELEVTERKHELDTRTAFLDRAIDSRYRAEDRARALRFLRAVSTRDSAMRDWTDSELRAAEGEAEMLKVGESLKNETAKLKESLDEALKREQPVQKAKAVQKAQVVAREQVVDNELPAKREQPAQKPNRQEGPGHAEGARPPEGATRQGGAPYALGRGRG